MGALKQHSKSLLNPHKRQGFQQHADKAKLDITIIFYYIDVRVACVPTLFAVHAARLSLRLGHTMGYVWNALRRLPVGTAYRSCVVAHKDDHANLPRYQAINPRSTKTCCENPHSVSQLGMAVHNWIMVLPHLLVRWRWLEWRGNRWPCISA